MISVSQLLILLVSAFWFRGHISSWISTLKEDIVDDTYEAYKELSSLINWFDTGGYDIFDICPEYEQPDRDLYYPDVKHCVRLSDQLHLGLIQGFATWDNLGNFVNLTVTTAQLCVRQIWNTLSDGLLSLCSVDAWKQLPGRITDTISHYLSDDVVLYNRASVFLIVTVVCLTLIYVVCAFINDSDFSCSSKRVTFSTADSERESPNQRSQRLAGIRPTYSLKKEKPKRKKRNRQRPSSQETSTDQDSCSHNGSHHDSTFSQSRCSEQSHHIDDEALRYIAGSATDVAPHEVRERIRAALQVIARQEDGECGPSADTRKQQGKGSAVQDCPGSVVYDIRYKDGLPSDVMDVLFCIDPKCKHDHGRYELRGCEILVKPANYRELCGKQYLKSRPVSAGKKDESRYSYKTAYSSIQKPPRDEHEGAKDGVVQRMNVSEEAKQEQQFSDSLDKEVNRTDSFPDWTAPEYDLNCPYCTMAKKKKTGKDSFVEDPVSSDLSSNSSGEDYEGSSSSSLNRDSSPRSCRVSDPESRRPDRKLMELLGSTVLEEAIGPPQANSSFQAEDETCSKPLPGTSNNNSPQKGLNTLHRGTKGNRGSSKPLQSPNHSRRIVKPLIDPIPRHSANGRQNGRRVRLEVTPVEDDSVPTFNEAELSLTRELQDSLMNESQGTFDLSELNRSLSFYGDVSMVELAASWIVNNMLDRVTKMFSGVPAQRMKDSLFDMSTSVMDTYDLIE